MKYRIMHDGLRYKVQVYCGWWILKRWRDLGTRKPPFTPGSWVCTYHGTRKEAQNVIDRKESLQSKIHKWEPVK